MDLDTLFSGMAGSEVNVRGEFFDQGLYTAEVLSLKYQNGFKGQSFIAKFKVLTSNNGTPAGVTRSWIVKLDKPKTKQSAMGDIKQLFLALTGIDPKTVKSPEIDPKTHEQATRLFKCAIDAEYAKKCDVDPNEFVGATVALEATTVQTQPTAERPNGGTFTRMSWSPSAD